MTSPSKVFAFLRHSDRHQQQQQHPRNAPDDNATQGQGQGQNWVQRRDQSKDIGQGRNERRSQREGYVHGEDERQGKNKVPSHVKGQNIGQDQDEGQGQGLVRAASLRESSFHAERSLPPGYSSSTAAINCLPSPAVDHATDHVSHKAVSFRPRSNTYTHAQPSPTSGATSPHCGRRDSSHGKRRERPAKVRRVAERGSVGQLSVSAEQLGPLSHLSSVGGLAPLPSVVIDRLHPDSAVATATPPPSSAVLPRYVGTTGGEPPDPDTVRTRMRTTRRAVLNVGGVRHEALWSTLERMPHTRLGRLQRCRTHDELLQICDDYRSVSYYYYNDNNDVNK